MQTLEQIVNDAFSKAFNISDMCAFYEKNELYIDLAISLDKLAKLREDTIRQVESCVLQQINEYIANKE